MNGSHIRAIVRGIADAAKRWCNADFPTRVRATRAVRTRTGYTEPVIDFAFDTLFGSIDAGALESTIASELGSLAALESFITRAARPEVTYRARSPIAIVSSDTTIGVAIPALLFAVCAQGRIRVKDRSDGLVRAFLETLEEELPGLSQSIEITAWNGEDDGAAGDALADAGAVVAFGRDATLRAIRARIPADASFVGYGHRTSIAYVARESLGDATQLRALARSLARDVLLYDGDGCLSPHVIFCERGGALDPAAFARVLAEALDEAAIEFPAGYAELDAAVLRYRDAARFRGAQGAGAAFGGTIGTHVLVLDPPRDEPPPLLRRAAAVFAVDGSAEASAYLSRHALPLEAAAFSQPRADLEAFALAAGASRICAFGELQRPPLGGEHGGAGRISPLVRAIYRA